MIPAPAQYLLRFDDLCPMHARERWQRFPPLLAEFGIHPILAIVPDNRDPALAVSSPDLGFWPQMRALQTAGATIGLHGFRHLCLSRGRSLVPLHRESEFAGVPPAMQRNWIHEGMQILRSHGLHPTIWVAPRHGFDRATLGALREEGIGVLSDGFARRPFRHCGLTWIPQQLWSPQAKRRGLLTICLHPAETSDAEVEQLRSFLRDRAGQFTTVQRVLAEFPAPPLRLGERLEGGAAILRIRSRQWLRSFFAGGPTGLTHRPIASAADSSRAAPDRVTPIDRAPFRD
jgi:predicted deacetylase